MSVSQSNERLDAVPSKFSFIRWFLCGMFRGHRYVLVEHGWPGGRYHMCVTCGDSYPLPRARIEGT